MGIEELETINASEIHCERLNAKEVVFPKENGKFIVPVVNGRIKLLGEDQDLRTSTLIRPRPSRGESHVDFLGESEGSFPPLHDSFPDAGDAINDFRSMSGNSNVPQNLIRREKNHSVLKKINVSRTTRTNFDVMQERRIENHWNIDGSRDLFDSWTG